MPMLSPVRDADAFADSPARCAQRAVVCTYVCPKSLPITGSPLPSAGHAK